MARVLIAVPTFESVSPDTFKSLWDLDKGDHDCDFEFVRGYDCARARTKIAEASKPYDYVLMVDSDVIVPQDALVNLMSHGVGVCMGFYAKRDRYDGCTALCELGRKNYDSCFFADELKEMRESGKYLIEVKGGGAGCLLVRTSVFERVPFPWFSFVVNADRSVLGEDYYFCSQCRKAGIKVYADTRVGCKHCFRHWQDV